MRMPAPTSLLGPTINVDEDTVDDILYAARVGDVEGLTDSLNAAASSQSPAWDTTSTSYIDILRFISDPFTGNNVAHLAAANAHSNILKFFREKALEAAKAGDQGQGTFLPQSEPISLFEKQNASGSTSLHYAAIGGSVEAVQYLVESVSEALNGGSDGGNAISENGSDPEEMKATMRARRKEYALQTNHASRTAANEAESASHWEVAGYLRGLEDGIEGNGDGENEISEKPANETPGQSSDVIRPEEDASSAVDKMTLEDTNGAT